MSVIGGASQGGAIDTGDIEHSLRFRPGNSPVLKRGAYSVTTDGTKYTFSTWAKRGRIDTSVDLFTFVSTVGNAEQAGIQITATGAIRWWQYNSVSGYFFQKITTALFRDPTSHFHLVCRYDTSNAVAEDRCQIFVNNVRLTSFSTNTNPSLNLVTYYKNGSFYPNIGSDNRNNTGSLGHFDGCLSRICFVDSVALDPTAFAYQNPESNAWVTKTQAAVKAVVDGGDSGSFMLDFDDGTSLTTLGYDKSSKGNNWTLNNFSLTPGPTYDWMLDTPSNNFAVLNNIYPSAANITNGNLSSGTTAARGTFNSTVFDSQWFVTAGASNVTAGVIDDSGSANTTTVTANKVFAFKMTSAGALSYKNVTDAGSWTSIATGLTGNRWPYGATAAASWNFGQQPLPEAFDTGFKALCTENLPDGETITTSGSFTGNASADGPYIDLKGVPLAMTINGNAVTLGTHADKTAFGFKVRSSSASYNAAGSNTYSITSTGAKRKYSNAQGNP